jgi:hypothetical protein
MPSKEDRIVIRLKELRVDGYKNIRDSKIPLGDFNVVVGPNNSGKTNLLEVFEMLSLVFLLNDELRKSMLRGFTGRPYGSSICHLDEGKPRLISLGLTFETNIGETAWDVDYEVIIRCASNEEAIGGFVAETLTAKPPATTGRAKCYLKRTNKTLKVMIRRMKEHPIATDVSALSALPVLYPEPEKAGLAPELLVFRYALRAIAMTTVFALSAADVRLDVRSDKPLWRGMRNESFDCLGSLDRLKQEDPKAYNEFRVAACDILGLEGIELVAKDDPRPTDDSKSEARPQRTRFCFLKRKGSPYADMKEFSDGTMTVFAVLVGIIGHSSDDPLICIEEPENCLHPAALEKLIRFLQEYSAKRPILLTTHSPYLLNSVNPEDVIVADVGEDGATRFKKPLTRKAIAERLKHGYVSFGDLLVTNFEDVAK